MKFCPNCGFERFTDTASCASCGVAFRRMAEAMVEATAAAPRRPGRRVGLAICVLVAMVVVSGGTLAACSGNSAAATTPAAATVASGALNSSAAPAAGPTRATPEDAVGQYLAAFASSNAGQLMGACAIDEVAAHFQFEAQATRLQVIEPNQFLLPTSYAFYADLDKYGQAYVNFSQVRGLALSLLTSQPVDQLITPVTADQAQQYVKSADPSLLAGLKVAEIKFPIAKFAADPKALANFAAQAKVYGADELTERLALVALNGKDYAVGFTLVRYGSDWKVLNQISNLAGTPASGAAQPMTQSDFDAAVAG
jgi:hypothetical protein